MTSQYVTIKAYDHGRLVGLFGCDENKLDTWMDRIREVMPSSARLIAFEPDGVKAHSVVVNGVQVY